MASGTKEHSSDAGWWAEYLPLWDEPITEGLQGASCHPACKAIAACAAGAWNRDWTAEQWRNDLLSRHHEDDDLRLIAQAEQCMRASGLWLWNS
jgi:hypothetical protein